MKIDVFDTYATHADGGRMHFDVLLPQGSNLQDAKFFALKWLQSVGIETGSIELDSCRFCHSQEVNPEIERTLAEKGFTVLQMEGCPAQTY